MNPNYPLKDINRSAPINPCWANQFIVYMDTILCLGMWNKPTDKELARLPRLYETENVPLDDKIIHQHYFLESFDWYVAEYGPQERIFFGYAVLNGDHQNAEWGYTSLDELAEINVHGIEVDRDLYWKPKRFRDVKAEWDRS